MEGIGFLYFGGYNFEMTNLNFSIFSDINSGNVQFFVIIPPDCGYPGNIVPKSKISNVYMTQPSFPSKRKTFNKYTYQHLNLYS